MDLETLTYSTLQTYLDKAAQIWGRQFPMPKVEFTLRGRVAGAAWWRNNLIDLNETLFRQNVETFVSRTIPHELAHIIARTLHLNQPIRPHGPEWQTVMRKLGLAPHRCHTMATTPARKTRKFKYVCTCQKYTLGLKRHKLAQSGTRFQCRKCKSTIAFLAEIV